MAGQKRLVRAGIVGLAASALVLTGCSTGGDNGDPGEDIPKGEIGGEAIYAIDTNLLNLDPNTSPSAQDARVMRQAFDNLVAYDENKELVEWLATDWKISDDGKEYTFTLRDDVTFWDDTKFNAEAVCFNLDRIKDPASGSRNSISLIGPYESCSAPDEKTAIVKFSAPYAPFMAVLTSPFLGMVSPTAAKAVAPADFTLAPTGSGPFIIESYTPADKVVLVANTKYNWGPKNAAHEGRAYLDKITYQIVPDPTVRLGSLRSGQFQAIGNVPEIEAKSVEDDPTMTFYAVQQSGAPFQYHFNSASPRVPLNDPKIREAIRLGFDIDSTVKTLYLGVYQRAWGPLAPTTVSYDKSVENSFKYDPEAAKKILEDAGWKAGADGIREKDGKKFKLILSGGTPNREKRQDIAEFFKANMKEIGIDVEVVLNQSAAGTQMSQEGTADIYELSLVNIGPNVLYTNYEPRFIPKPGYSGFNLSRTDNAALTAKLLEAQQESDAAKRDKLYSEIQKEIIKEVRSVAVYVPTFTMATNGIQGMRFDAEGYPIWYDVSLKK